MNLPIVEFETDYAAAFAELRDGPPSRVREVILDPSAPRPTRFAAMHLVPALAMSDDLKLELLVKTLSDQYMAIDSLRAFEQLGDRRACVPIRNLMATGALRANLKGECLVTLGKLGDTSIYPDCERVLSASQPPERIYAVVALAELATRDALSLLQHHFGLEKERGIRRSIACLLARHGVTVGETFLCLELEREENRLSRLFVAVSLANLSHNAGIDALRAILTEWDEREMFKVAMVMLRFTDIAMAPEGDVRLQVLAWLGRKADPTGQAR